MERKVQGGLRTAGMSKSYRKDLPIITVITVIFNGKPFVRTTFDSVLNQSYPNVEYIVIDGGSTDGTLELLQEYDNKVDLWISEPDKGIYDAMNKGIDLSTGDWINFMNVGDRFASPDVLDKFCDHERHGVDIVYGDALIQYENFEKPFKTHPLTEIWKYSPFCHQASFARAKLLNEYKLDTNFTIGADHDFFYRAYKAGKKFSYLPTVVCYFDGRQGMTKRRIIQAIKDKRTAALRYEYSLRKAIYFRFFLLYIRSSVLIKKLLGPVITDILIRLAKNRGHHMKDQGTA